MYQKAKQKQKEAKANLHILVTYLLIVYAKKEEKNFKGEKLWKLKHKLLHASAKTNKTKHTTTNE